MKLDLNALEEVALRATPGERKVCWEQEHRVYEVRNEDGAVILRVVDGDWRWEENRAFMEQVTPEVVQELIARSKELDNLKSERVLDRYSFSGLDLSGLN